MISGIILEEYIRNQKVSRKIFQLLSRPLQFSKCLNSGSSGYEFYVPQYYWLISTYVN